jgi:hypothetical protein
MIFPSMTSVKILFVRIGSAFLCHGKLFPASYRSRGYTDPGMIHECAWPTGLAGGSGILNAAVFAAILIATSAGASGWEPLRIFSNFSPDGDFLVAAESLVRH